VLTENEAWELTFFVGLEWSDDDRTVLGPLSDAALVFAKTDAVAEPIIDMLWEDGLREDLERALAKAAERNAFVARMRSAAEADLAGGPRSSLLARAVVEQGAFELAYADLHPLQCLLCVEELLRAAPEGDRQSAAIRVARIATRVAAVPPDELRAAVAGAADPARRDLAAVLATDERRRAVRSWLGNLAELGAQSVPTLSAELGAAVRGPLPAVADDQVWRETVLGLTDTLDSEWN